MEEINKINELMNNNNAPKSYKEKDRNSYPNKTSSHNSKEWGINLGENLSIKVEFYPSQNYYMTSTKLLLQIIEISEVDQLLMGQL